MFKMFFHNLVLLALYVAGKPRLMNAEEEAMVSCAESFLREPYVADVILDLQEQNLVDTSGYLTKKGLFAVKRYGNEPRNVRQLNFERLFANATPGYTMAAMFTAEKRLSELWNSGAMKKATPETIQSLDNLANRIADWSATFEARNHDEPVTQTIPAPAEGEE